MTSTEPRFPDYGDDGDLAGARRARKSFRLCVTSLVLLTVSSFFAERSLRFTQPETNYLSGITQRPDAGRVFLRSAIRLDAQSSETPTAKYSQALAVRQEDDVALETYAEALTMDPTNSLFALRFGAKQFILGHPAEAAETFVRARALPPANGLPRYLHAASVAQQGGDFIAMRDAMVIMSRANNTRDPLIFPKPIWFSGYPQTGQQYAFLSRETFTEVCAPLYTLSQWVVTAVHREDVLQRTRDAQTWLEQLKRMGERLVSDAEPRGVLQAMAGVTIQLQALSAMEQLLESSPEDSQNAINQLDKRQTELRQAMELLSEFEAGRDARISAAVSEYQRPLLQAFLSIVLIVGAYLLARLVHTVLRYRKTAWTLPHSTLGKWVLGIGTGLLVFLFAAGSVLQQIPGGQPHYLVAIQSVWWGVVMVLLGFGLIYPALTLESPEEVSSKSGRLEDMPETVRLARRAYRRVYMAFLVRYYGILNGLVLSSVCVWIIAYRVLRGLYPWQINLLADGLLSEELDVVNRVLSLLS